MAVIINEECSVKDMRDVSLVQLLQCSSFVTEQIVVANCYWRPTTRERLLIAAHPPFSSQGVVPRERMFYLVSSCVAITALFAK